MKLALLLLVAAGLLNWAALELNALQLVGPASSPPTQASAEATRMQAPSAEPAAEAPAPITIAPLFRPAAAPASSTPQVGEELLLVGLATHADVRIALIRDAADGRTINVRAGDRLGDWTAEEMGERCVVLRRRSQRRELCLS